ncbi:MAG TPA: DinB family protein [Candidatus Angelobacter sp.]|nr:DinB family protein [Candidatus Angelobacter sp.]
MATATTEKLNTKVVPPAAWSAARKELLAKEKEFTRLRDDLGRLRRELPWEKVQKNYVFDGPKGKQSLADLFDGRSQLIIYHFMFGPGWKEGCPSCSFLADTFDGAAVHMAQRDTTLAVVSRATLPELQAFQKRMGWRFPWVSSFGNDFNVDYRVSFAKDEMVAGKRPYNYGTMDFPAEEGPGLSVFYKNAQGEIFHTYSTYARGLDILLTAYNFIDMTPKGRDEADMVPHAMAWVRHHDRYANGESASCCGGEAAKANTLIPSMLCELREEVKTTRRILERVPSDKLAWRPHPKSMTLGQLAIHIASVPGAIATLAQGDGLDVTQANFAPPQPKHAHEVLATFEASVAQAETQLKDMTDDKALGNWTLKAGDKQLSVQPRIGVLRTIMLNHWYHHRGQLSVYLRLLDVPVPVVYGPSADENPFG